MVLLLHLTFKILIWSKPTVYRKGAGTIYTNPAFDKEVLNAELYRRDPIYPTKLDKSLDDRIQSPYVRTGDNQTIERGEAEGAGVLHKRKFAVQFLIKFLLTSKELIPI